MSDLSESESIEAFLQDRSVAEINQEEVVSFLLRDIYEIYEILWHYICFDTIGNLFFGY